MCPWTLLDESGTTVCRDRKERKGNDFPQTQAYGLEASTQSRVYASIQDQSNLLLSVELQVNKSALVVVRYECLRYRTDKQYAQQVTQMKTVFCDESGFSGNNLWDPEQPHFAFAGVQIEEAEASDVIREARAKYRIQSPEVHATKMLRKESGQEAVLWILERIADTASALYMNKRFALAGRMFEYLMEPIIAENSYPFYQTGFHRFWANLVYFNLLSDIEKHQPTFQVFQRMMRTLDSSILRELLESMPYDSENMPLCHVVDVLTCNQKQIIAAIAVTQNAEGISSWILDLSFTSVQSILTFFSGSAMEPIVLVCDDSKPLRASEHHLNEIGVDRMEFVGMELDGRQCPITFSLDREVIFSSSKDMAGLQLADVVASSTVFALKNPVSTFANRWREIFSDSLHENCIVPDADEIDLESKRALINARILSLLSEQSIRGVSVLRESVRTLAIAKDI